MAPVDRVISRSVPKIAIFEEAARTLEIPGGVRMIQEYYRQMGKFGCNILAVVQQYDVLKTSEVRGAMIGNSKIFLKLKPLLSSRILSNRAPNPAPWFYVFKS